MILRVAVIGALGRMGRILSECIECADDCQIAALVGRTGSVGSPYIDDPLAAAAEADVMIDFSLPEAFDNVVSAALSQRTPLVSGTTGLSGAQLGRLNELARVAPCFHSPNMSVGVQTLLDLLTRAVGALGADYQIDVVETHHRLKRDAPSGTAKRILETLGAAQPAGQPPIPVHSIRGGDVVGDHTVAFMGPGDRLELTHRATSRKTFAMGALRAARWLVRQTPGRYGMSDLLEEAS